MLPNHTSTAFEPSDLSSPPVFRLTDDALLAVLRCILADHPTWDEPRPNPLPAIRVREDSSQVLATLLCSAQVCQKWRSVMATSPFLWANSVDLDVLSLKTPEWVTEFMTWTKQAPLRVYALHCDAYRRPGVSDFVLSFLNEHWGRMREVTVTLSCSPTQYFGDTDSDIPETKKLFLKQPAPLLESISIHLSLVTLPQDPDHPFRDPRFMLFDGHTPALRKFECRSLSGYLPTHSVAELRHLKANFDFVRPNLLSSSISAFSLETLSISSNRYATMDKYPNLALQLPSLRRLTIVGGLLNPSLAILRCIKPSSGCALYLEVHPEWTPDSPTDLPAFEAYVISFFAVHVVSHLEMTIKGNVLHLSATCCCLQHTYAPEQFIVQLRDTAKGIVCQFLTSLLRCDYSSITDLSIQVGWDHNDSPPERLDTKLEELFALLSSVTTLQTSIYFLLEFLMHHRTPILLPNLAHVLLGTSAAGYEIGKHFDGWVSHNNPSEYSGPLCSFAAHRRDVGAPLSTLDKSRYWINRANQELPPQTDTA